MMNRSDDIWGKVKEFLAIHLDYFPENFKYPDISLKTPEDQKQYVDEVIDLLLTHDVNQRQRKVFGDWFEISKQIWS